QKVEPGPGGHGFAEATYGGKICENLTSGICRDLLAGALLACERAGLPVVLHAHDEVVVEVDAATAPQALRRLAEIMSTPPPWADSFPLAVEAFACGRYVKSPPPEARVVSARNGVVYEEKGDGSLPPVWQSPAPSEGANNHDPVSSHAPLRDVSR